MKLLRDLAHFLQFSLVVMVTCALVVGAAMVGQNWLGASSDESEQAVAPSGPRRTTPTPGARPTLPVPVVQPSASLPPWSPPPAADSPPVSPTPQAPAIATRPSPTVAAKPAKTLYGHLPYPIANVKELVIAGDYYGRKERLHRDAATAFNKMLAAARRQNIPLKLASGFRDKQRQQALFARQLKRKGSKAAAAKWSAPPGYSEHHTGYALDVGDGQNTDFTLAFAQTPTYGWMLKNASQYGFELSFPENNSQGVSFEPWHWRYVGNDTAKQIFRVAQQQTQTVN